jgi:hypothetical protein
LWIARLLCFGEHTMNPGPTNLEKVMATRRSRVKHSPDTRMPLHRPEPAPAEAALSALRLSLLRLFCVSKGDLFGSEEPSSGSSGITCPIDGMRLRTLEFTIPFRSCLVVRAGARELGFWFIPSPSGRWTGEGQFMAGNQASKKERRQGEKS